MLPSIALAILLLPCFISAAPTTTTENGAHPTPPLLHRSSSSYGRCSNWNPFQCRITEIINHTVVQHFTSTVYVTVDIGAIHSTFTIPHDITRTEDQAADTNAPHEYSITYTACEGVTKGHETPLGVSTSTLPEMTTVSYQDPDCANCIYSIQHEHRTPLDEVVSIWTAHPQREHSTTVVSIWDKHSGRDKARPTGKVSIWEGAGMMAEPSVSIEKPHYKHKQLNEDSKYLNWDSRPQCLKRSQYTYTATVGSPLICWHLHYKYTTDRHSSMTSMFLISLNRTTGSSSLTISRFSNLLSYMAITLPPAHRLQYRAIHLGLLASCL